MTFRELVGYRKSQHQQRLEDWDRTVWSTQYLLQPHLGKGGKLDFYEMHPMRDKREEQAKDRFNSQEDIMEYMKSLQQPSNTDTDE